MLSLFWLLDKPCLDSVTAAVVSFPFQMVSVHAPHPHQLCKMSVVSHCV